MDEKRAPKAEISFIEDNQLTPTLKRLKKLGKESLDFLAEQLHNESLDLKDKIAVAKYLIDKQVQINDSVAKDQMARLIAEVKVKGLSANRDIRTVVGDDQPKAIFTTSILCHEKTSDEYVPPEEGKYDAGNWKTL